MMKTGKMGIIALICAFLAVCLISCTGAENTDMAEGRSLARNSTATDYNPDGTNNYGQINSNNGNTDGGTGDRYDDKDMSLNGVADDIADAGRNMVNDAASGMDYGMNGTTSRANDMSNSVERNNGVNAKNAVGNTAGYY